MEIFVKQETSYRVVWIHIWKLFFILSFCGENHSSGISAYRRPVLSNSTAGDSFCTVFTLIIAQSKVILIRGLSATVTEEKTIIYPCSSRRQWGLDCFFHDGRFITSTNHPLHLALALVQSKCNVQANWPQSASYFWMPPFAFARWVRNTSRYEVSPFPAMAPGKLLVRACGERN